MHAGSGVTGRVMVGTMEGGSWSKKVEKEGESRKKKTGRKGVTERLMEGWRDREVG